MVLRDLKTNITLLFLVSTLLAGGTKIVVLEVAILEEKKLCICCVIEHSDTD